jgi:hypothetical protein
MSFVEWRRSVSTLSPSALLGALSLSKGIPRALVLSAAEGSDRGVEWVDFNKLLKIHRYWFKKRNYM